MRELLWQMSSGDETTVPQAISRRAERLFQHSTSARRDGVTLFCRVAYVAWKQRLSRTTTINMRRSCNDVTHSPQESYERSRDDQTK